MKTNGDKIMLYIGIIVFLIGASAFVYFRFFFEGITFFEHPKVSQEFVYNETKECNKDKEKIMNTLIDECNSELKKDLFGKCKRIDLEIFYSPEKNECVVVYHYNTNYYIRGILSDKIDKFTAKKEDDSCIIFKNGKKIKKTKLGEVNYWEDSCYPRAEEIWIDEVEKLKKL